MAPTPDRWQQIEALYHAALERGRGVLDDADPELRREVERLLAVEPTGEGLLDQPAAALLAEPVTMELKPGMRLGPYQIEALIGQGGMGKVYRAHDTRLGRTVAIKTSSARFIQRFKSEARAIAALNHPHICHLYDVGPDYLVMEYIEGTPLKGPFPFDEALEYAEQISNALDTAHQKGIIHRDLKPANILLTKHGIKLLDFGVAQMKADPDDPNAPTMTMTGAVMGTPGYMAPEQMEGKRADARSDIYAFGCVLYQMLTGKHVGRVGRLGAEGSPELERILTKCLENDPDLRYQHASEIRADLLRLKRDTDSARVATPTGIGKRWKVLVPTAVAVLAAVVGVAFYFPQALHGKPKLTDKDTIVLADFANNTGDPVFDGTLRQGLAVALEQSPYLSLVSDRSIQKWLGLMGQPADARLTAQLAAGICERTASAAVLDGSVARLGSQYVLGLRAVNCRTGDVLDEEQGKAASKEEVLNALSQIASKFRTRVGESLAMVQKHSIPLAEATTPSLDALKAYSAAMKVLFASGDAAALPLFRRAVEIDPKFALAQAHLGITYGSMGESALSAESIGKAWQLRDRASDAERFFIDASYDVQVTGNLEKAKLTCEAWARTYPRDPIPVSFLPGMIYPVLGQYERAVEEGKKSVDLDPDFAIAYNVLALSYVSAGRLGEAEKTLQRASERKLEIPDFLVDRYQIAFLRGDLAAMDREAALSRGKSGAEDWLSDQEALVLAYTGRLQEAKRRSQRAAEMARQSAQRERAAGFDAGPALWDAFFGNESAARQGAVAILDLSKGREAQYGAALALALSGESGRWQTLASDLEKRFPEDTAVQFSYLPTLRASSALHRGEPGKAIELLQIAIPNELGEPPSTFFGSFGALYPVYVRGEAYLAAHQGAEAATEFQKILDHRGIVLNDPIGALAHLQLGRALVLSGDQIEAKAAYQDFLTLWKDADPDIPILMQARAEFARLR